MLEYEIGSCDPKTITWTEETLGKYTVLSKECGITRYKTITLTYLPSGGTTYKSYTKWIEESKELCTIGEAEDGDFVDD